MFSVGGIKEKVLTAHRGGITTVIIPLENERDLVDIPKNIKQNLTIKPVRWIDEVLNIALTEMPKPSGGSLSSEEEKAGKSLQQEEDVKKKNAELTKH